MLLGPHLRSWVDEHLISPRQVCVAIDTNGTSFKTLWLVTDRVGENDSSYRVVYDDETDAFGLECTLDSGVEWYMETTAPSLKPLKICNVTFLRRRRTTNRWTGARIACFST